MVRQRALSEGQSPAEAVMARDEALVSAAEVARFGALAQRWWDPDGPMRPLHQMNRLRVDWITQRIEGGPDGVRLLDLGCGAGIAAEALARRGFSVLGVDASEAAIAAAREHARAAGVAVTYRTGLADDLLAEGLRFPAVTALEVIEHVPDQKAFMAALAGLLQPGGTLFVSTLNRTLRSLAVAKIGAEYVARLLPAGTHDWRRFVGPEELAGMARAAGLRMTDLSGMAFSPGGLGWRTVRDVSINYIAAFVRP
jgi:2-polyprenyl-6-hydroxyphenyl methylase/3-demethylubiquinone-9 3-methyltransferase